MVPNLQDLMKQAQAMQSKMQQAQKELANLTVVGEAGGGLVKITMLGTHDVKKVEIDPSLLKADEIEMLEDLVAAATNDAVRKVAEISQSSISKMTSVLNLPEGFNPFG